MLDSTIEECSLQIGDKSPDFVLSTEKGEPWRLFDQFGKVTALFFYPKNETLICVKQMCSLRDHWKDYLKTKASIVGISPDSPEDNLKFAEKYNLPLTILADPERQITKIYGSHWLFPINFTRTIVVVDAKGFIRHQQIMLRALRPTDRAVLASIYEARADFSNEHFEHIVRQSKEQNNAASK